MPTGAMTQRNPRKKRTLSRASTASVHSIATQPNMDHHQQAMMGHPNMFPEQWIPNEHGQPRDMTPVVQQPLQPGDMMLRPASQLQGHQSFSMDANMHSAVGPTMTYPHHNLQHPVQSESFGANASFTDTDNQLMDRDDGDEVEAAVALRAAGPKGTGNKANANNELEMRQLFRANRRRTLQEVAGELHGNERGPNSERARQVFAMLWLNGVCTTGKGSVPRGRVYANYAARCATERITVLNPASFGKLVRVLFPGLKTRRLGVRGESKYHYVNFNLIEDQPEPEVEAPQPALPFADPGSYVPHASGSGPSQSPALNAQQSVLPSPTLAQQVDGKVGSGSSYGLFNHPDIKDIDQLRLSNAKTMMQHAFPPEADEHFDATDPLILPKIDSFLPAGTDPDAAKSLTALYRSHCTSLVECIRFCKAKPFFHLYTAFQGTLTMPVQKLFVHHDIAPWIEECDFVLYQRMARIVFTITLQVMPPPVLDLLRKISEQLIPHIRASFQELPLHVLAAKEAPAAVFTGLLDRALRCNLTAHAAANMLSLSDNRDEMYIDWLHQARLRKAAESVPAVAMDDVVDLLLEEIRGLICPMNVPWEMEENTLYGQISLRKGESGRAPARVGDNGLDIIGRWNKFLRSLPRRFPYATTNDLVNGVQSVGLAIMRDFTMNQNKSFGSWWVLKCWIDEMVTYIACYGGFLKTRSTVGSGNGSAKATVTQESQQSSRLSNSSDDFSMPRLAQPQPDRAPFPTHLEAHGQDLLDSPGAHDDSGIGIGIRTPEEDFPMDKLGYEQGDDPSLPGFDLE